MSPGELKQKFREAFELPEDERFELAELLLETLPAEMSAEVEAAWAQEIARRVRQIDDGSVETIPWEEVKAKLTQK